MTCPDFFPIEYRPDLHLLVGRWQRMVSEGELYVSYPALLEAAVAHQCRFWMLDARRRHNVTVGVLPWLLHDFAPRLEQHLGGRVYLAFLVAPLQLTDAVPAEQAVPPVSNLPTQAWLMQRFLDEGDAVSWLQQQQASEQQE